MAFTSRIFRVIHDAKLTAPVPFRNLLQLRTHALGVEHQRAGVAAEQIAAVGAHLAKVVVILRHDPTNKQAQSRHTDAVQAKHGTQDTRVCCDHGRTRPDQRTWCTTQTTEEQNMVWGTFLARHNAVATVQSCVRR